MRRAYTLIEILVVVAIIGVIVAILFPVFSAVRENGRMAKCISNLHQWGTAIQMYRDDWGGADPQPGMKIKSLSELGFPWGAPPARFWKTYGLDAPAVRFCPSAPRQRSGKPSPYYSLFWADEPLPPEEIQRKADRGADMALMVCAFHNRIPLIEDNPTWGDIRVVVLRLNQQVSVRVVKSYPLDMIAL